jgi:hypothetical protein
VTDAMIGSNYVHGNGLHLRSKQNRRHRDLRTKRCCKSYNQVTYAFVERFTLLGTVIRSTNKSINNR